MKLIGSATQAGTSKESSANLKRAILLPKFSLLPKSLRNTNSFALSNSIKEVMPISLIKASNLANRSKAFPFRLFKQKKKSMEVSNLKVILFVIITSCIAAYVVHVDYKQLEQLQRYEKLK
jgi:hypothetical protein